MDSTTSNAQVLGFLSFGYRASVQVSVTQNVKLKEINLKYVHPIQLNPFTVKYVSIQGHIFSQKKCSFLSLGQWLRNLFILSIDPRHMLDNSERCN